MIELIQNLVLLDKSFEPKQARQDSVLSLVHFHGVSTRTPDGLSFRLKDCATYNVSYGFPVRVMSELECDVRVMKVT